MPELPEVEIARRTLVRWFKGHEVRRAESTKTRIFRGAKPKAFEAISGPMTKAERKGKYLLLSFGTQGVLAHLGMTGKFVKRPKGEEVLYSRARFELDTGDVIHFRDPRMFGRIEPVPSAELWKLKTIEELGIDPLTEGLDAAALKGAVGKSKQELKVALMDQGRITGLGNIHATEAMYRAKLHPSCAPMTLTDDEWSRLTAAIHAAIQFGLDEQEGDDEIQYVEEPGSENPFLVYGREGEECGNCNAVIVRTEHGGRSSFFCPECQPNPGGTEDKKYAKVLRQIEKDFALARPRIKKIEAKALAKLKKSAKKRPAAASSVPLEKSRKTRVRLVRPEPATKGKKK